MACPRIQKFSLRNASVELILIVCALYLFYFNRLLSDNFCICRTAFVLVMSGFDAFMWLAKLINLNLIIIWVSIDLEIMEHLVDLIFQNIEC